MQRSQLADLLREWAITLVIQLAQLRPSLLHGCLGTYLTNTKSVASWVLKERSKLYVALNAVRQKASTTWTDQRTLEQPAAQSQQDQLSTAAAQIHSQESDVGRYWSGRSRRTRLVLV